MNHKEEFTSMDFGISTDLVPSLLNMYDALYARLSEPAAEDEEERLEEGGEREKFLHNGYLKEEKEEEEEEGKVEKELTQSLTYLLNDITSTSTSSCASYGNPTTSTSFTDLPTSSYNTPVSSPRPPSKRNTPNGLVNHSVYEGIYDNVERKSTLISTYHHTHTYTTPHTQPTRTHTHTHTHTQPTRTHTETGGRQVQSYRPLSSISSTSSSSSSSGSLSRRPQRITPSAAGSCLASVESLECEEDVSGPEDTARRRDRSIKIRRDKAHRTGSGDSGFQCSSISLPAPPPLPRPRYFDNNLAKMDRTVLEIVDTEAIYVRDLRQVIEGYLQPWRKGEERGITAMQVEQLFSNIEQIYSFNKSFLSQLESCGVNPVSVARCFVNNNEGFTIYTHYCTNYPRTVSLLTELMRGTASLSFRERQIALGHSLPLGSYLLKPVQRILKYHLLLGNIVKHLEEEKKEEEEERREVLAALSAMTGIARHINDMKRKHEHAVRVQEIQSLLYGWEFDDLTTYGELAAEGTFRLCGAKGLRHVFLFERMILIAKKKEESVLVYKTHIMCSNLMLIESVRGEPLSFHVIPFDNPRFQYTLQARNLDQKREWTLQLKRVILENYAAAIPAHARQLVMELGQNAGGESGRVGSRRGAHHAPEYLERRKADRGRRRSADTVLPTTRLKLRRPSRTRKLKEEEKGSRSRSVSRTRETEEEEEEEEEDEEEEYRKISTASTPTTSLEKPKLRLASMWGRRRSEPGVMRRPLVTTPTTPTPTTPTTPITPLDPKDESPRLHTAARTSEVARDGFSTSECEIEDPEEEEDEGGGGGGGSENLEEIVGGLLQHSLRLQRLLLSKPRRRRALHQYLTSDSECDDPPATQPPPPPHPPQQDLGDYVDFYFNHGVKNGVSSSEVSVYSSALSVAPGISASTSTTTTTTTGNHTTWTTPRRSPDLWNTGGTRPQGLRRAQSFSVDTGGGLEDVTPAAPSTPPDDAIWVRGDVGRGATRDRPVTIALGGSSRELRDLRHVLGTSQPLATDTDASLTPPRSLEDLSGLHPAHRIYHPATPQTPPSPVSPASSGSSGTLRAALGRLGPSVGAGMVGSVARQCTRSLKARIKQIRAEESLLPMAKQGSAVLGARLAGGDSDNHYATPILLRPRPRDSLLSSTSSSSTSSTKPVLCLPPSPPPPSSPESDGCASGDSFYERCFESSAVGDEMSLEEDPFRDSAIYSDPDEETHTPAPPVTPAHPLVTRKPTPCPSQTPAPLSTPPVKKVPPPVPAKPDAVRARGRAAPVVIPPGPTTPPGVTQGSQRPAPRSSSAPPRPRPLPDSPSGREPQVARGWVRHVIGRLQAGGEG